MNLEEQLTDEIQSQLENDILYFAWMVQIAKSQRPDRSELECTHAVLESILKLHNERTIIVGNAYESNGKVYISAWSETNEGLRERLKSEIAKHSDPLEQSFCFWIQLSLHHTE